MMRDPLRLPTYGKQTVVMRGGDKRPNKEKWSEIDDKVIFSTFGRQPWEQKAVELSSLISSAGGQGGNSHTSLAVRIGPKDFPALLRAMSAVAGQAALFAMCEELRYQLGKGLSTEQKEASAVSA